MIRSKQMEEIRGLDKRLRSIGIATMPNLEKHVMIALVSGEKPKIKTTAEIASAARLKMVSGGRYGSGDRTLAFADVFASCNGYEGDLKAFTSHEKARRAALSRYEREAEKILVKALDQEADAPDIVEQLHDAAERAGLNKLTQPVYSDSKAESNDD